MRRRSAATCSRSYFRSCARKITVPCERSGIIQKFTRSVFICRERARRRAPADYATGLAACALHCNKRGVAGGGCCCFCTKRHVTSRQDDYNTTPTSYFTVRSVSLLLLLYYIISTQNMIEKIEGCHQHFFKRNWPTRPNHYYYSI